MCTMPHFKIANSQNLEDENKIFHFGTFRIQIVTMKSIDLLSELRNFIP